MKTRNMKRNDRRSSRSKGCPSQFGDDYEGDEDDDHWLTKSGGRAAPANLGNLGNLGTGVSDFSCQSWPTTPKFPAQTCLKTTTTLSSSTVNNRKDCSTLFMVMSGVEVSL